MDSTKKYYIRISEKTSEKIKKLSEKTDLAPESVVEAALNHFEEAAEGYNGWSNYETWCVYMWLTVDSEAEAALRSVILNASSPYEAVKAIRDWVDEMNPIAGEASMFSDLLRVSIDDVNWLEIYTATLDSGILG